MRNPMKLFLLILLLPNFFWLLRTSKPISTHSANICTSPPLTFLLETYYQGHPYKFAANIQRFKSPYDFANITLGNGAEYDIIDSVSRGNFAAVYRAKTPSLKDVAMKIHLDSTDDKILKEIQILENLKDAPNFLPISDIIREPGEKEGKMLTCLVFDLLKTEKFKIVYPKLTRYQVKLYFYEILRTLE